MKNNVRSGFGGVPSVRMARSKFDLSHGVKTSMNVGTLYPLDIVEILPGDTFKVNTSVVARVTSSFLKPVMDNLFMDIFHFFVPYRLVYDDSKKVFGNPKPSAYSDNDLASFPYTVGGTGESGSRGGFAPGTVADYFGLPVHKVDENRTNTFRINVLPFRSFALIYNEWFRNENVNDEVHIQTGGGFTQSERLNNNPWSANNYTGQLPKVTRRKDYFTTALPSTQKGKAVELSLGSFAPVVNDNQAKNAINLFLINDDKTPYLHGNQLLGVSEQNAQKTRVAGIDASSLGIDFGDSAPSTTYPSIALKTDLSRAEGLPNVNDFRLAFQTQKMLEKDALYGSRYNEFLLGHFGVSSPDARLQFTEYLGGGRIPLNVQQVAQTSAGTEQSPQANLSGYSLSNGKSYFNKGFVEHGYVITVGCIRQVHSYSQGVAKMWGKFKREDLYDPVFANIGEQPIYTSELYQDWAYHGDLSDDNDGLKANVFGYNEAWADYRSLPSKITGQMRPELTDGKSLGIWHFGDHYASAPTLSSSFINETEDYVDRTLSVSSAVQDQFIIDLWFDTSAIRVMPTFSVPGLIDHH